MTLKFSTHSGAKLSNTSGESTAFENPLKNVKLQPPHPFVQAKLTSGADSREVQSLLAFFRANGGRLPLASNAPTEKRQVTSQNEPPELPPTMMWPDCLDPASHQRLSVLFCSFLHNSNT